MENNSMENNSMEEPQDKHSRDKRRRGAGSRGGKGAYKKSRHQNKDFQDPASETGDQGDEKVEDLNGQASETGEEDQNAQLRAVSLFHQKEMEFLRDSFNNLWRYELVTHKWYHWQGSFYNEADQESFEHALRIVMDEIIKSNKPHPFTLSSKVNSANYFGSLATKDRVLACKTILGFKKPIAIEYSDFAALKLDFGVNFLNGFWERETRTFNKQRPTDIFFDYAINVIYDGLTKPDLDFMVELYSMFGFDPATLWMFKDAIYRILIPIPRVQTHLLFKGPAKSGKSVVESFYRELVLGAKHAMHIGDFSNSYMLANSKDKRLCTLSEVHSIDPKKQGAMKAFTAHDVVSSQIKFVQSKISFRPYGLMILTTNDDPFEVFKSAELMDRFFVLEFIRSNKTDIKLIDRFRENMMGLVNWALATDYQEHLEHVRSSQINVGLGADQNIYTRFIGDHLVFDKDSCCTVEAIASRFNEFKEDGALTSALR